MLLNKSMGTAGARSRENSGYRNLYSTGRIRIPRSGTPDASSVGPDVVDD